MASEEDVTLEKFVSVANLPQMAKVTQGYDDTDNVDNEFSTNDVIKVYGIDCPRVDIIYKRDGSIPDDSDQSEKLTVSTRNVTRFRLHCVGRPRLFSGVAELIQLWPMTIRAMSDHRPPVRPGNPAPPEFVKDDILHLVRYDPSTNMLECRKNDSPNIIRLSCDYNSQFVEVVDPAKFYTLGELAKTARIPRLLRLRHADQRALPVCPASAVQTEDLPWIVGIPTDFDGLVMMERPNYFVELSLVIAPDEDDDDKKLGPKLLVPMDNPIRVQSRDSDYIDVRGFQMWLSELANKKTSVLPRIIRIVDWQEETTVLRNHFVRPGQLFVFFERQTVSKLAVTAGRRRFFVPLTHRGRFRRLDDNSRLTLNTIIRHPEAFPFSIRFYDESDYINLDDDVLPADCPLRVDAIIDEDSVLVARISDDNVERANVDDAFHLPLRTRVMFCFSDRLLRPVRKVLSCRNDFADEVTESTYNDVLHPACEIEVGYVRPQRRSCIANTAPGFRLNAEPPETSGKLHRLPDLPPASPESTGCPSTPPNITIPVRPSRRRRQPWRESSGLPDAGRMTIEGQPSTVKLGLQTAPAPSIPPRASRNVNYGQRSSWTRDASTAATTVRRFQPYDQRETDYRP